MGRGDEEEGDRKRRGDKKRSRRKHDTSSSDDSSLEEDRRRKSKKRRREKRKHKSSSHKRSKKRRKYSSSESSSSSDSDSSSDDIRQSSSKRVVNQRLLEKLEARGETMEERKARRAAKRATKISSRFGYTAEDNPFNDPNIHEAFVWSKKKNTEPAQGNKDSRDTLEEIDNIRRRRKEREQERDEMERLRAEESRMKELEKYDDWAKKEEEFHLQQQRQRSAIRLVEGRQRPIDVLAKNLLLFGLSEEDKRNGAAVKYQEKYNALNELESLDVEMEDPKDLLSVLKLAELKELVAEIELYRRLEREARGESTNAAILDYWDSLHTVTIDEIAMLQNGGEDSEYAKKINDISKIFGDQSEDELFKLRAEIQGKIRSGVAGPIGADTGYWENVAQQLEVHLAKLKLAKIHSKMLVRQLERLEERKNDLRRKKSEGKRSKGDEQEDKNERRGVPDNVPVDFGNNEEEVGAASEVDVSNGHKNAWEDKYKSRKPRYFNRVKTGYDWNKYNQTHYDQDNPPPKTVQGYKFNIFYPDLADPTKTPRYFLEPADTDDFCIIRFHAGPPYEDIAFRIVNREWNRSRKKGFKCTFERGVLSLYFNFTTHWYRR